MGEHLQGKEREGRGSFRVDFGGTNMYQSLALHFQATLPLFSPYTSKMAGTGPRRLIGYYTAYQREGVSKKHFASLLLQYNPCPLPPLDAAALATPVEDMIGHLRTNNASQVPWVFWLWKPSLSLQGYCNYHNSKLMKSKNINRFSLSTFRDMLLLLLRHSSQVDYIDTSILANKSTIFIAFLFYKKNAHMTRVSFI